jgi:carbamoyltransferase
MKILGISAFYHDSAAALLDDGRIVAAAQEERFTRKKFDAGFPAAAVRFCLEQAGCSLADIDFVACHDKPLRRFDRLFWTHVAHAPRGFAGFRQAMGAWLGGKLFQRRMLARAFAAIDPAADVSGRLLFAEHHQSHAASAFFASPFDEALVLTVDGVGEWATTTVAVGAGNRLEVQREIRFPHSLGLLYAAITQYIGFKVLSGEYKVMGLAPYGRPVFKDLILTHLIDVQEDGSFHLDQSYFDYCVGGRMFSDKLCALFGQPARRPETDLLTGFHMDVAASVQAVTEEVMLRICAGLAARHGRTNLCLAGGVALNCVANGRILRSGLFRNVWIQPAAGDAGCAPGAALAVWYQHLGNARPPAANGDAMSGAFLGPAFAQSEIEDRLRRAGAVFEVLDDADLFGATVAALVGQEAVGWFQGRMEFGPRALGARSILADPRAPDVQKMLNLKVKFRESFRPFAPAVLREDVSDWFAFDGDSPYMLFTADVRPEHRREMTAAESALFGIDKLNVSRSTVPAITHVDYSARLQTVDRETNPRFHRLLSAFKAATGCPVLVNTSFNVRGEPIVCSPEDAFRCFMGTDIDVLVAGNCFLRKDRQDRGILKDYRHDFEPD